MLIDEDSGDEQKNDQQVVNFRNFFNEIKQIYSQKYPIFERIYQFMEYYLTRWKFESNYLGNKNEKNKRAIQ